MPGTLSTGKWLANAGFINGMPGKIRVMEDCIVIR
ncbi:SymE family type I addiction module toxin [Enterobacter cancerogenus]